MLQCKLATGDTFKVSAVSESLTTHFSDSDSYSIRLSIECTPSEKPLDEYTKLIFADGALDRIEITSDTETASVFEGYTKVIELNQRVLATGEKSFSMDLAKP